MGWVVGEREFGMKLGGRLCGRVCGGNEGIVENRAEDG